MYNIKGKLIKVNGSSKIIYCHPAMAYLMYYKCREIKNKINKLIENNKKKIFPKTEVN